MASADGTPNSEASTNHAFERNYQFSINDSLGLITSYVSRKSGLAVTVADIPGPVVDGCLVLATEAHDDDGLPHTLEHLVFMGSEDYPYKGVLDLLANRSLASGTNAWTDTDHTAYTLTTAGDVGFRNLLPIYLDHVLYPTLVHSAYITEVHHVNGEGDDAGVVYCEMQARENSGESRTYLELSREMYPGRCGYKSETGGLLKNLRESCSHRKVVEYHAAFYRPDNLCVIIAGAVNHEEVLHSLKAFDDKISSKGRLPPLARPWSSPVPPLERSVDKLIEYGADDEDHGMVVVAWRSPEVKDFYRIGALTILLKYLANTAVSPLQKEFVEKHPPLSNDVSHFAYEYTEGLFGFHFSNVPVDRLDEVASKLLDTLEVVAEGDEDEAFDLVRMRDRVRREIITTLCQFEDDPHGYVTGHVIGHFLYGSDGDGVGTELERRLNDVPMMRRMESEPASFWRLLIKTLMLDPNKVVIRGKSSKDLMEKMAAEEKERLRNQRRELGETRLGSMKKELEEAIEKNEEAPPTDLLESVSVPPVDGIQRHSLEQYRNFKPISGPLSTSGPGSMSGADSTSALPEFDVSAIPVPFQFDQIDSKFFSVTAFMNSEGLDPKLQFYLPLYLELIFETCLSRDGGRTIIPHTQLVAEISRDTVSVGARVSFSGLIAIGLKVDESKFRLGVNLLKDVVFHAHFTEERVKTVATKRINDLPSAKRNASQVRGALEDNQNFVPSSLEWTSSFMRQHTFLTNMLTRLESDLGQSVLDDLTTLKHAIAYDLDLVVHAAGDARRLAQVVPAEDLPLTKHFSPDAWPRAPPTPTPSSSSPISSFPSPRNQRDSDGRLMLKPVTPTSQGLVDFNGPSDATWMNHLVIGVGSVESAYITSVTPTIRRPDHEDLPALNVLIEYLTQTEGPMWCQIRGQGLAYSFGLSVCPEVGLLYFSLSRATHLVEAFKEAAAICRAHINGEEAFDELEFEASKSSLIFQIIEGGKTVADVAGESITNYFLGLPLTHSQELISMISKVEIEELAAVGRRYLLPVFDAASSRSSVVCHPTKVESLQKEFQEIQYFHHLLPSLEHDFLASLDPSPRGA